MTQIRIGRLLLAASLMLWGTTAMAAFTASVDHTRVTQLDLVNLTVDLSNEQTDQSPDFGDIEKDFDIINRSGPNESTHLTIINGQQTGGTRIEWTLSLRPKRLGQLTIPAIHLGSRSTQPIDITVTKASEARTRHMNELVFFDTSVDTDKVYVQGQVMYTVKLYYSDAISGNAPSAPDIDDAVVEPVEKEKRYESIINNRRYYVLETSYAIFPQKSGKLVIPQEVFNGSRGSTSFFSPRQPVSAVSEPHTITVEPRPAAFNGKQWLPAKSLVITESWGKDGKPSMKVGDPVNRVLTMTAKGVASSLLPTFPKLDLPNAKVYEDPPDMTDDPNPDVGIVSTESVTVGIVPTQPGKLTLPEIRIPWWNTKTDKMEVAVIPAETFDVAPAPGVSANIPTAPPTAATTAPDNTPVPTLATPASPMLKIALGVVTLLWLLTIWAWWHTRRQLKQLSAGATDQVAVEAAGTSEADAWGQLVQACKNDEAIAAANSLFLWARRRFPGINASSDIARYGGEGLKAEINKLDAALYSPQGDTWHGGALLAELSAIRDSGNATSRETDLAASINPA